MGEHSVQQDEPVMQEQRRAATACAAGQYQATATQEAA